MRCSGKKYWALILGGSSGFGLAAAKELAECGMNICIVHRDRRGALARIETEFAEILRTGVELLSCNLDALSAEGRETVLNDLQKQMGEGRVRVMLHSIAFGSLKLIAPLAQSKGGTVEALANALGCPPEKLQQSVDSLFEQGADELHALASAPEYDSELLLNDEEVLNTANAMGISLLTWTQALFSRKMFCSDARVIGLTSEGNEVAWLGYAAVSAAKASLEAIARSIAREFGPHGIRCNIVQPGVTNTPALRLIPGSAQLMARAKLRNPLGRLTAVADVGRVVAFLASDDAAWINGSSIRVDGGEHIAGM